MWNKSKLDFEQLRAEIKAMSARSGLYKLLRDELLKLDHWKNLPRGNPRKANSMVKNRKF